MKKIYIIRRKFHAVKAIITNNDITVTATGYYPLSWLALELEECSRSLGLLGRAHYSVFAGTTVAIKRHYPQWGTHRGSFSAFVQLYQFANFSKIAITVKLH